MQVYNNGVTRVIGSAGRKKHERKDQESRISITIYCTGSIYGVTGPTILLMEVNNKCVNYIDRFLRDNGTAPGSNVLMTSTAFMTEEAWIYENPPVVHGLKSSGHIVAANPQWWIKYILHGFFPHTSSLKSMQLRADTNIQSIKDEGDSSRVNKVYDKYVSVQHKV